MLLWCQVTNKDATTGVHIIFFLLCLRGTQLHCTTLCVPASVSFDQGGGGGGGGRRGLGPRNDVLTTCKAVTLRDGQRIIAAFFSQ